MQMKLTELLYELARISDTSIRNLAARAFPPISLGWTPSEERHPSYHTPLGDALTPNAKSTILTFFDFVYEFLASLLIVGTEGIVAMIGVIPLLEHRLNTLSTN